MVIPIYPSKLYLLEAGAITSVIKIYIVMVQIN